MFEPAAKEPEYGHFASSSHGVFIDSWGAGPYAITAANGLRYTFEDSQRFGPILLRKDGSVRDRQPGENHPFWDAYEAWVAEGRLVKDDICIFKTPLS